MRGSYLFKGISLLVVQLFLVSMVSFAAPTPEEFYGAENVIEKTEPLSVASRQNTVPRSAADDDFIS